MPHVITDTGHDLGEVTDTGALDYYRREPGFVIDGVEVAPSTSAVVDPQAAGVERPDESALKGEWVDYAKTVDPGNADAIDAMTKAELVDTYGGGEDDTAE